MGTTYNPAPTDGNQNWGDWLRNLVSSVDDRITFFELLGFVSAEAAGILPNTGADSRLKVQQLLDATKAAGKRGIVFGPGTWDFKSSTTGGGTAWGLWNQGVSIYGEQGRTIWRQTGTLSNIMQIAADLSSTATATINANTTVGQTTFPVDSFTWINSGDLVAQRITQNGSDPAETRQGVIATLTVNSSTSVTTNRASQWAMNTGTSQDFNRRFTKILNLPTDVTISGIEFQGDASTRHAIGVQWAARLTVEKCIGDNVGSGLVNAQWVQGATKIDRCYVRRCGSFGNTSKGRALSLSNMDSVEVIDCRFDNCEGAELYIESYCQNVQIKNLHLVNNLASRSQPYSIFWGYDCGGSVENLQVEGSGSSLASTISYGTGPGLVYLRNVTMYMPLSAVRALPLATCSGYLRVFDAAGVLRTFDCDHWESTYQEYALVAGGTPTLWFREGLITKIEVTVSAGVTATMLPLIGIGRSAYSSQPIPTSGNGAWVAGSMVRIPHWTGGVVYPMNSRPDESVKAVITVASSATLTANGESLPAGAYVGIRVYSVASDRQTIAINEPGSVQAARFRTT